MCLLMLTEFRWLLLLDLFAVILKHKGESWGMILCGAWGVEDGGSQVSGGVTWVADVDYITHRLVTS